jgi:hypothetical protein
MDTRKVSWDKNKNKIKIVDVLHLIMPLKWGVFKINFFRLCFEQDIYVKDVFFNDYIHK